MDTPTQLEAGNEADSHMADLERSRDSVMQSRDSGEETHDSQEDSEAEGVCTSGLEHDGKFHKYAYVEQGFTSEIFKIEIENFPKYTGYKQIRKRLRSLNLNPVKIKKGVNSNWCFVTFHSEEEKQEALKVLSGYVWKKNILSVKVAKAVKDPIFRKRQRSSTGDGADLETKRQCMMNMTLEERLANAVTPLAGTPYSEQLQLKHRSVEDFLRAAAVEIRSGYRRPPEWLAQQVEECGGMLCPLEDIRPSPVQTSYRNKCDFSLGLDSDKQPVVGFRLASYEEGDFTVAPPDSCIHVSQLMKDMAKAFQTYIGQSALQPPYSPLTTDGYWRQVTLRCTRSGETMAIVQLHPQQLTQEELVAEKKCLVEYFTSGEGSKHRPHSLYLQCFSRKTKEDNKPKYEHLMGNMSIHEEMLGMSFRISPDAFFQTNTAAAEVLYSLISELVTTKESQGPSIIYDICCGTGTIGLYLAKMFSAEKVIGVEMNEQAIGDAKTNATSNGIDNAEFVCGKAEDVLSQQMQQSSSLATPLAPPPLGSHAQRVVGVVDPPRAGLHPRVVQVIRSCSAIKSLVYVSCNPNGALKNIIDLCREQSHRLKGLPFHPVRAVPVDLFPHTGHCELVMLLERAGAGAASSSAAEQIKTLLQD